MARLTPPRIGGPGGRPCVPRPERRRRPKPVSRATVGCPVDLQHRSPPPAVWCRHHRAIQAADATYARTLTLLATAQQAVAEARALRVSARNRRTACQRALVQPCARDAGAGRPLVHILRTASPDGNALA